MSHIKNFAISTVAVAPSPKTTGTTLSVSTGDGTVFPTTPFYATAVPSGQLPTVVNAEIVRVDSVSADMMTIVRAQRGTTAKSIDVGWQFYNGIYAEDIAAGEAVQHQVSQTSHGFSVGKVIGLNGNVYELARADSASDAEVVGIVSQVLDANTFVLTTEGYVSGLSGLTVGVNFVSATSAGALTATMPTADGTISKPVFYAESASSGYFHNYRGVQNGASVGGGGGGGTTGSSLLSVRQVTSNTTFSDTDDVLVVTTPGVTVTFHDATGAMSKRFTIKNASNGVIHFTTVSGQHVDGVTTGDVYDASIDAVPFNNNWIII